MKRSRNVQDALFRHEFEHCDMALYLMQLQSVKGHRRMVLKRGDLADVRARLKIKYPYAGQIPQPKIENIPSGMLELMNSHVQCRWKLEWMYHGDYQVQKSPDYVTSHFMSRKGCREVFPKLMDTGGFDKPEKMYKLWIESLMRPDQTIRYEGVAFRKDYQQTVVQTVRMMSHIYDHEHVVTLTLVE